MKLNPIILRASARVDLSNRHWAEIFLSPGGEVVSCASDGSQDYIDWSKLDEAIKLLQEAVL